MKLVIDRPDDKKSWRWSLVEITGLNVKILAQGLVDGPLDAFVLGYAEAIAKFGAPKLAEPTSELTAKAYLDLFAPTSVEGK